MSTNKLPVLSHQDQEILRALHGAGRAPWEQIAERVSCSASTARRRYAELVNAGLVRIVGATDVRRLGVGVPILLRFNGPAGELDGFVQRLRSHDEVRFLAVSAGSVDCIAEIVVSDIARFVPLVQELVAGTTFVSEGFIVTHTFTAGEDWLPGVGGGAKRVVSTAAEPTAISDVEAKVLAQLMSDGRAPVGQLAEGAGCSQRVATAAIESLRSQGLLDFRVLLESELLGYGAECHVWLDVHPASLKEAGVKLAADPTTRYLSATAGRFNLAGQVVLSDIASIYEYTDTVLAGLPGVRAVEVTVHAGVAKRVWTQIIDGEYATPTGPVELVAELGRRRQA